MVALARRRQCHGFFQNGRCRSYRIGNGYRLAMIEKIGTTAVVTTSATPGRSRPVLQNHCPTFCLALCETAMVVACADDQKAAHRRAVMEINRILAGLVVQ